MATVGEDLLANAHVGILGLGLMGGSLALALRGKCASLWAVDPDPVTLHLAQERQIVERISPDPAEILPHCNLIILAAPVLAIIDLLHHLPALHPGPAVVMDLGSTKALVVRAMQALPEHFDPIGGHPMCGKEKLSLANADPALFQGAPFALTALERTSRHARRLAEQIIATIGAKLLWIDPQTHDRWVAATSHFPYLLSSMLACITPLEAAPLVGPGFRSTTRLAGTPPEMMLDVLTTNHENILGSLHTFREQLEQLEKILSAENYPQLQGLLTQSQSCYKEILGI